MSGEKIFSDISRLFEISRIRCSYKCFRQVALHVLVRITKSEKHAIDSGERSDSEIAGENSYLTGEWLYLR